MLAPALLVTVALVFAAMPFEKVPVMLPELVTLAASFAEIPGWPVMLAPALLVTVAEEKLAMPLAEVLIMLPELATLAAPNKA